MTTIANLRFNNIADGTAISQAADAVFNPISDRCIARVTPEGNLRGGVVYTNYTGPAGSIGMQGAGFDPRWINRDMLWVAFDYPFNQLGVKRIFMQIPVSKVNVLDLTYSLGFWLVTLIEDVYPDGDMALVAMYREDCRFLEITPRNLRRGS